MFWEMIKKTAIKTLTELAVKLLFGALIVVIFGAVAYIAPIGKTLVQFPAYGKISFALLVASVIAVPLSLIWAIRLYWRYERFQEAFGVFWDKNYKMRCLSCRKPLKHSSRDDASMLYCSKCNCKHILKDADGNKLSPQAAIDCLKQGSEHEISD